MTSQSNAPSATDNFEGIIKYKFLLGDVKGLTDEEIDAKIARVEAMIGRQMVYYIKGANVKSVVDGEMMKLTTYQNGTDSVYMHSPGMESKMVPMSGDWNFKYDTIITKKNVRTISGYPCDLIRFQNENFTWDYYYSDALKVDPEHYKYNDTGFWSEAIERCGSLPIRYEGKIPGTYMFLEVEEILEQAVPDSEFELPKE